MKMTEAHLSKKASLDALQQQLKQFGPKSISKVLSSATGAIFFSNSTQSNLIRHIQN